MATAVSSIDFDGTNDVIDYTTTGSTGSNMNYTSYPFTISAWVSSDAGQGNIFSRRDGSATHYQMYVIGDTQFNSFINGGINLSSLTASFSTLGWVNLTIVLYNDGTNRCRFYQDALVRTTNTCNGPPPSNSVDCSAGARWDGYPTTAFPLNGRLAHIRCYSAELTQNQINELMWNPGSISTGQDLWTPCWDSGTQVDLSDNGNDGTLTNGPTTSTSGPPVFLLGGQ